MTETSDLADLLRAVEMNGDDAATKLVAADAAAAAGEVEITRALRWCAATSNPGQRVLSANRIWIRWVDQYRGGEIGSCGSQLFGKDKGQDWHWWRQQDDEEDIVPLLRRLGGVLIALDVRI